MKGNNGIPLVLENRDGQVLRSLSWDAPQLHFIIRARSGRLETHHDLDSFTNTSEAYELIRSVNVADMTGRPIAIGPHVTLRRVQTEDKLQILNSEPILKENDEEFKKSLKASFIAHAALALLGVVFLLTTHFLKEEDPVVKIELSKEMKLSPPKAKVRPQVKPSAKKVVARSKVSPRKAKPVAKRNPKVKPQKIKRKNVSQMGALAALGGSNKGAKGGRGLKLKSALSGPGSGNSAGTKSLGAASAAFAGKGLSANSGGGGKSNLGQVGYGTKGRSGGQSGYGQMNIGGSADGGGYEPAMGGGGSVDGGLAMSQIEAVIQQNIGQIYYCYEKGLQKAPQLQGRVVTDFVINGSGRVGGALIGQSSLRASVVEKCMLQKLRSWKFPKPVGGVDVSVSYPFNLKRAR